MTDLLVVVLLVLLFVGFLSLLPEWLALSICAVWLAVVLINWLSERSKR